jgi:hypothetical protein
MPRANVIRAPAGLGKTQAFAKKIADATDGPYEVYVPTIALAEEWRNSILKLNPTKEVVVIRGRSHLEATTGMPMCQMHTAAEQVSKAGFTVYASLCKKAQGKNNPSLKCAHYDSCAYLAQFSRADVYIYTHAYLPLARGALETWSPVGVVIDESFFQTCLAKITMPISLLTHPTLPAEAKRWCAEVATYLTTGQSNFIRVRTVGTMHRELRRALRALDKVRPMVAPGMPSGQVSTALANCMSFGPLRALLTRLDYELSRWRTPRSIDYNRATGEITLHHRKNITRFNSGLLKQPKIVNLDANASLNIIRQFFTIDSFLVQDVARNAYVIQCHSTKGSTTSFVPNRNKDPNSRQAAQRRLIELQALIGKLCADGQRVLVVGPTAIVGNDRDGTAALFVVPSSCEFAHFNAIRGVDRWKSFDTVVIVGRNEPPLKAVEDMARALFFDQAWAVAQTGKWDIQPRGYRIDGQTLGVDVNVHADPGVQALVEQLREGESLQAIDRLRHVHSVTIKTVIVLSSIPLDIDVDETRTWAEIMHGTRLERAWERLSGVMPLNPAWLAGHFPDLWATEAAARNDIHDGSNKSAFANSIHIRKTRLYLHEYKDAGARRWSRCISINQTAAVVKGQLEAITGQSLKVRLVGPLR